MASLNQNINFYQDTFKKPVIVLPLKTMLIGWVAITVALFLLVGNDYLLTKQMRSENVKMQSARENMQSAIGKMQAQVDVMVEDPRLKSEELRLREALQGKHHFLHAVQKQANTHHVKFSEFLNALYELDHPNIWLTDIRLSALGPEMKLSGLTSKPVSVPQYLQGLNQAEAFQNLGFKVFNVERDKNSNGHLTFSVSTQHYDEIEN